MSSAAFTRWKTPSIAAFDLIPAFPLGVSPYCKSGSLDVPGFRCLCVPGGMFFNNCWVYFAFIINGDAEAEADPATATAFLSATSEALTRVFNTLSA
jgi:beta-lactamase class A